MRMWVHGDIKYVVGMLTCIFFLRNYHFVFYIFLHETRSENMVI